MITRLLTGIINLLQDAEDFCGDVIWGLGDSPQVFLCFPVIILLFVLCLPVVMFREGLKALVSIGTLLSQPPNHTDTHPPHNTNASQTHTTDHP